MRILGWDGSTSTSLAMLQCNAISSYYIHLLKNQVGWLDWMGLKYSLYKGEENVGVVYEVNG